MRFLLLIFAFISLNTNSYSVELVKKQKAKPDALFPPATIYYFKTKNPIEVDYIYGYDDFLSEVALKISFNSDHTNNEDLLRAYVVVGNIDSPIIKKSYLGKLESKYSPLNSCFYTGKAIVELSEIGLLIPDVPSETDAWAIISKINALSVPRYTCN